MSMSKAIGDQEVCAVVLIFNNHILWQNWGNGRTPILFIQPKNLKNFMAFKLLIFSGQASLYMTLVSIL